MDDLDHNLIALLRVDARAPVSALAARLKVSRATVRARLDRLIADGDIQGFTVLLKSAANRGIRAVTLISVEGRGADKVLKQLYGLPEVRTLHSTNGRWDIVAQIETDTLEAFDDTLRRVRLIEGISDTETNILLSTKKQ